MRVLVFDPSGNFGDKEGQGTTGWSVWNDGELTDFGRIDSKDFNSQESYWESHARLIHRIHDRAILVVMESYKLFAHKANAQSWSTMDTPQLIGYLRMYCWSYRIPVQFQDPSDKQRVTDPILVKMGIIEKRGQKHYCLNRSTVIHERDAIRHGVFFHKYGKGKVF